MYRLKRQPQVSVVHLLCEGNSIRSIERLTGAHRDTTMRLLVRVGRRCHQFLDGRLLGLRLDHLRCDEIWTFCLKKQGRLTEEEKSDDTIGDQSLFVALDQETRLIPSFLVGKRNRENTEAFMLDLADRVLAPLPGSLGPRPQISTDGWAAYPGAVDLAFADTVKFGALVKSYGEAEQPGRYGPPELAGPIGAAHTPGLRVGAICTSHVERGNLCDPHVHEAVRPARAGVQQEAGEPDGGGGAARRPLQLLPVSLGHPQRARDGGRGGG